LFHLCGNYFFFIKRDALLQKRKRTAQNPQAGRGLMSPVLTVKGYSDKRYEEADFLYVRKHAACFVSSSGTNESVVYISSVLHGELKV